jgi:hypothetical protein
MRVRGEAGRGSITLVAFLVAALSLVTFIASRGFADPPKNPVLGGGPNKSDCYVELDVQGATDITKNKVVNCIDGDPCDTDGMCDGTCTFKVALCPNQPGLAGCTPPSSVTLSGKSVASLTPPTDLSGSACGAFADVKVALKGKHKNKPGKTVLHVKAKGPKGTKPKTDADNVKFVCKPRTGTCPTTTSTTTTTTTMGCVTSTTTPCAAPAMSLSFTTSLGTTSCGGGGLNPAPAAPTSGELDSDTGGTTKIKDLVLACLYFGGGNATIVPPGLIPDNAASYFSVSGSNLTATASCGPTSCTKGTGPGSHCINAHCNSDADCDGTSGSCAAGGCKTGTQATPLSCTTDNDCGASAGSCAPDANCYFGPPLPILSPPPQGALTTCVLNVIQTDGSGTIDTATGESTVSLPLSSRVYITGNTASPCPKCVCGTCNYGERAGQACSTFTSLGTTNDCPPILHNFQAPLPVTLDPLTTGTAEKTDAGGSFCPSQTTPGAFGQGTAQRIAESGTPGGNLTDNQGHHSVLASVFCIPATGNPAVDGVADIPGPGAIGLNGTARLNP